MKLASWSLASLLLLGCGAEAAPSPEPEAEAEPDVLVEAPPDPEPEPLVECPAETWAVGSQGTNTAAADGAAAASLARQGSRAGSWERLSVCRTIDGVEHHLICAPGSGGAECNLGLPGQRCSATLPGPMLPVAVGQLVDTSAAPAAGEWRCSDAD